MSQATTSSSVVHRAGAFDWRVVVEASKPGIVKMVALTAAIGFVIRASVFPNGSLLQGVALLVITVIGTALAAAGANVLNQAWEAPLDAKMRRTCRRPIPSGRLARASAWWWGIALVFAGGVLLLITTPAAALLSFLSAVMYVIIYTPMKTVSPLSTIVGAAPGALPCVVGWAAAGEGSGVAAAFEPGGWALFMIVFAWQMPHFLAIAWRHREDYAKAGMKVLPVVDPSGERMSRAALTWSLAMVPIGALPALAIPGVISPVSTAVAALGGLAMLLASKDLAERRTDASAKTRFFVSIVYLPLVLTFLVSDALIHVAFT
ncbi:MAG: heme o synthase [Planctomycetota bacterium]